MGQKFIKLSNFRRRQTVCGYILVGVSFLLLSLLTVKTFAPQVETDAASQTASQTVGPYSLSMANDSVATINITPTASQAVYTASNNLSVTNTCTSGATITMTVNSTTSNALTRSATNSDTLTKTIAATSGSSLVDNSWGYSKNNGTNYYAVPLKNATPATIYDASAAQTSALSVPVLFGVKTDNNLPSGNYTNTVVYTMTPKSGCLTYSITWDMDGGTKKSGATYPTSKGWGETVNLSQLTPTKSGYTFDGWTNGSSNYTGSETAANLNSANAKTVTVKAKWKANDPPIPTGSCTGSYGSKVNVNLAVNGTQNFDYTGSVTCAYLQKAGYYKLEVWGARGGGNNYGYGGYSFGKIYANSGSSLYVVVGGQGQTFGTSTGWKYGGWNGGGGFYIQSFQENEERYSGTGGGGSDISTSPVSFTTDNYRYIQSNYGDKLIVAGGGGGGYNGTSWSGIGGNGGGYQGGSSSGSSSESATGGSQSDGGTYSYTSAGGYAASSGKGFGSTESTKDGHCCGASGGGGWYGGGSGNSGHMGGGGGSGYIGNSLLLSDKGMYQYSGGAGSCSSSSATAIKTTCTSSTGNHVANVANTGNGYARITYLGT